MTVRQEQAQSPAQQGQIDATRQAVDSLDARMDKPHGIPTRVKTAAYQAQWGDLVRCNGTFTVTLPATDRKYMGQAITVKNEGATGTITVIAIKGDTVDGAAQQTISPMGYSQHVCAEPGKWIRV